MTTLHDMGLDLESWIQDSKRVPHSIWICYDDEGNFKHFMLSARVLDTNNAHSIRTTKDPSTALKFLQQGQVSKAPAAKCRSAPAAKREPAVSLADLDL